MVQEILSWFHSCHLSQHSWAKIRHPVFGTGRNHLASLTLPVRPGGGYSKTSWRREISCGRGQQGGPTGDDAWYPPLGSSARCPSSGYLHHRGGWVWASSTRTSLSAAPCEIQVWTFSLQHGLGQGSIGQVTITAKICHPMGVRQAAPYPKTLSTPLSSLRQYTEWAP